MENNLDKLKTDENFREHNYSKFIAYLKKNMQKGESLKREEDIEEDENYLVYIHLFPYDPCSIVIGKNFYHFKKQEKMIKITHENDLYNFHHFLKMDQKFLEGLTGGERKKKLKSKISDSLESEKIVIDEDDDDGFKEDDDGDYMEMEK